MNLFSPDNKFMQIAGKFADLIILNFLALIFSLPIITIGASLTAMYNVLLKLYRDEDGAIVKQFVQSFLANFKRSTIILLAYSVLAVLIWVDFRILEGDSIQLPFFLRYLILGITLLIAVSFTWVFALQSRYENKLSTTIRNSFIIGISNLLYSLMMILFDILPVMLLLYSIKMVPIIMFLGITVPGFLKTILYSKVFNKLEGNECKKE